MRHGVDEVAEGDEGCGETDRWAIEGGDQDLWMGVKGVGDVEVVRDKVAQPLSAHVWIFASCGAGNTNIGTSRSLLVVSTTLKLLRLIR